MIFVCAEWNYEGLPVWLNSILGTGQCSDSPVWEKEMERFIATAGCTIRVYIIYGYTG